MFVCVCVCVCVHTYTCAVAQIELANREIEQCTCMLSISLVTYSFFFLSHDGNLNVYFVHASSHNDINPVQSHQLLVMPYLMIPLTWQKGGNNGALELLKPCLQTSSYIWLYQMFNSILAFTVRTTQPCPCFLPTVLSQ